MRLNILYRIPPALGVVALLLAGCGSDETTEPVFGDLEFSPPSPVEIGDARQVDLELSNLSNGSLGPLVIGSGDIPLSVPREFACPSLEVVIAPGQVQSIAAGRSIEVVVSFNFADLTEMECPLATYEVDINAALGQKVLGSVQVRLDHLALE